MKLYGIIGYPLAHSFSKKYFTQKFDGQGITDCRYDLFPIRAINELPGLIADHPNLQGLNITIPYKKLVMPYLSDATGIPEGLNACNCVKIINGGRKGYNTDIIGFERSLLSSLREKPAHALVLGNGGAADAVRFVLQKLLINYTTVSRAKNDPCILTYDQLDKKIIEKCNLVINTTPLGSFPAINECPDIPYQFLSSRHLLFDLNYNPAKTLFLSKGEQQGAEIQNGYEMLVQQAEESWKIWQQN